ncbi:MAG: hypothetical protein GXX90_10460 [Microbacteriaceae bacterium]|nr:hypothetical protein [Microbacteriaceae bacterium]
MLSLDEQRRLRRRLDRIYGIALFIVGIGATIVNMQALTEQSIVMQIAAMFEQYEAGDYVRAEGLAALGWAGIVAHPLNYALWLYVALRRWRAERFAAWCAIVGAVIGWLITVGVLAIAAGMHPRLVDAVLASVGG